MNDPKIPMMLPPIPIARDFEGSQGGHLAGPYHYALEAWERICDKVIAANERSQNSVSMGAATASGSMVAEAEIDNELYERGRMFVAAVISSRNNGLRIHRKAMREAETDTALECLQDPMTGDTIYVVEGVALRTDDPDHENVKDAERKRVGQFLRSVMVAATPKSISDGNSKWYMQKEIVWRAIEAIERGDLDAMKVVAPWVQG